jgi:hypothetical protein
VAGDGAMQRDCASRLGGRDSAGIWGCGAWSGRPAWIRVAGNRRRGRLAGEDFYEADVDPDLVRAEYLRGSEEGELIGEAVAANSGSKRRRRARRRGRWAASSEGIDNGEAGFERRQGRGENKLDQFTWRWQLL